MISGLLLILIYLAFISLGLPDSLFGASWTVMRLDLGVATGMAGVVSMIVALGTVVSSLSADRLIRRFGTGRIVLVSVLATAAALVLYSISGGFWSLCLAAIPLGLGGGCVDAALNNYVAVNYKARHMSWLHCMWGVGVTASPLISTAFLAHGVWRSGYTVIAIMQFALSVLLAAGLPLWRRVASGRSVQEQTQGEHIGNMGALKIRGVKWAMAMFFCYCAAESLAGLWGATYLADVKGLSVERAALGAALYYGGLTAGRLINGFLTMKFSDKTLAAAGAAVSMVGAAAVIFLPNMWAAGALAVVGIGFAPIYPCTIHQTPLRFGVAASQAVTGLQMATAYTGVTLMPPLFGLVSRWSGMSAMPFALLLLIAAMALFERMLAARLHFAK